MKKLYKVIFEDAYDVYKELIPAENEKEARKEVEGNGEIIKITDVTTDYPISIGKVMDALKVNNFGKTERTIIERLLYTYQNWID